MARRIASTGNHPRCGACVTTGQSLAFLLFSFVAAITPGPSNLMLTASGAVAGVRGGLPCLVGVACGMGLLILVVGAGVGHLTAIHPFVLKGINGIGAAFLFWLSWKIATARPADHDAARTPVGFWAAAAFQWINPKSWIVGAAAAGTYLQADASVAWVQPAWLALLFVTAALPSGFVWLLFGASMQRFLRSPTAARRFNLVMGAALAASVLTILF